MSNGQMAGKIFSVLCGMGWMIAALYHAGAWPFHRDPDYAHATYCLVWSLFFYHWSMEKHHT